MRSKRIGLGLLIICLSLPSCILGQDVGPSASENPVRSLLGFFGIAQCPKITSKCLILNPTFLKLRF